MSYVFKNLSDDLIIKMLIDLDYLTMIKTTQSDKYIYNLYKENEDYIYRMKILNEMPCLVSTKDVYLFTTNKNTIDELCIKNDKFHPSCNITMHEFSMIVWVNNPRNNSSSIERITSILKMISFLDRCFSNNLNLNELLSNKKFLETVIKTLHNTDPNDVPLFRDLNKNVKRIFIEYYNSKVPKIIEDVKKHVERISTVSSNSIMF